MGRALRGGLLVTDTNVSSVRVGIGPAFTVEFYGLPVRRKKKRKVVLISAIL